jgi:glycine/D-amino acid oxidase-like deaminating enzyme
VRCDDVAVSKDVAIIGAGIVGCATAYYLAREGVSVAVYDPEGIAAGASGRNNGLIEHPYDQATEPLFEETVGLLAQAMGDAFAAEPAGTLIVCESEGEARAAASLYAAFPQLKPRVLDSVGAREAEPLLAEGVWGCLLHTGHPVMPLEVTTRFAELAREAGAEFVLGSDVGTVLEDEQIVGVQAGGTEHLADVVLVAAGAGSGALMPGGIRADMVTPLWGVIVAVELPQRPRCQLIEGAIAAQHGGGELAVQAPFTLLDSPGWLAVGSTMLTGERPDSDDWVPQLLRRGTQFVPSIAEAEIKDVLVCARPRSFDNRPILGRVPGQHRLWVATGHGGRGMSTGPASARLMADAIIAGNDGGVPAVLSAGRLA